MNIWQTFNNCYVSYRYSIIIRFGDEAVSLLPFLSEKHICILFLTKHYVMKWYYMKL